MQGIPSTSLAAHKACDFDPVCSANHRQNNGRRISTCSASTVEPESEFKDAESESFGRGISESSTSTVEPESELNKDAESESFGERVSDVGHFADTRASPYNEGQPIQLSDKRRSKGLQNMKLKDVVKSTAVEATCVNQGLWKQNLKGLRKFKRIAAICEVGHACRYSVAINSTPKTPTVSKDATPYDETFGQQEVVREEISKMKMGSSIGDADADICANIPLPKWFTSKVVADCQVLHENSKNNRADNDNDNALPVSVPTSDLAALGKLKGPFSQSSQEPMKVILAEGVGRQPRLNPFVPCKKRVPNWRF